MSSAERNSLIKVRALWTGVRRWRPRAPASDLRRIPHCPPRFPTTPSAALPLQLVLNITAALSSFQRWTVGLGIEPQLNSLRAAVGLPALQVGPAASATPTACVACHAARVLRVCGASMAMCCQLSPPPPGRSACPLQFTHTLNLDYDSLVKPWLCEQTLTCETYTHGGWSGVGQVAGWLLMGRPAGAPSAMAAASLAPPRSGIEWRLAASLPTCLRLPLCAAEDFFFRTIHLGTDCWAFVALSRLRSAQQCAEAGNWHVAAARATQVRLGALASCRGTLACMHAPHHLQVPAWSGSARQPYLLAMPCRPATAPRPAGQPHPAVPGQPRDAADLHEPVGLPAAESGTGGDQRGGLGAGGQQANRMPPTASSWLSTLRSRCGRLSSLSALSIAGALPCSAGQELPPHRAPAV